MVLPDPLIGRKLGDYKIVALLGKGGMARVYKGFDEALQRYAAVKVITGEFATADEAEYTARFQREARAIARLHHPNIVSIYQFGQVEGMYYMAMVFLDGKDLRIMLKEAATRGERIPPLIILKMAREICSALDYAHTQGVIHRDIKPSNIMMTTNGAVLTDFGLALTTMEGTLGDTFGSAHYIAPEQAVSSARAVPQSDLYSFGVVLYEALTGKVPFDDPSAMTVALKHLNEEPPPPTFYNPDLPSEVEKVLLMALHKDPRQRYATCHDLYLALDTALKRTEDEDTVEISTNSGPKKSAAQAQSPAALEAYLKTLRNEPPKPTTQGVQTVGDVASNVATQPPPVSRQSAFSNEAKTLKNEIVSPPYRTVLPPMEEKRGNRWLWLAGMIPILLLLVGIVVVVVMLGQNDDDKQDNPTKQAAANLTDTPSASQAPTESPTQDSALLTLTAVFQSNQTLSAIISATATRTLTPSMTVTQDSQAGGGSASATATPTSSSTATATASATSTSTPTASETTSPTVTPTPTITPSATSSIPPEIRLEYSDDHFVLYNISNRVQNIGNLSFQGSNQGSFEAFDWNAAIEAAGGDIFNFASQGCVQISIDQFVSGPSCRYYNAYIWRTDSDSHFWRTIGGNTTFTVLRSNQAIAECEVSAGVCEFALP
ncbi:MAG: hypothetical protein BroJett018_28690 [Chloroflexota bacterium]|nr:serine/threonine protein kinase [Chloroflexota bacterium]NOG63694.1 serine/threonine protein kinase [Chloroflexota bacterium]GIK65075.1 MAG: hypothetical protein BroJett018_28690 [Chloroflexota bacterium]